MNTKNGFKTETIRVAKGPKNGTGPTILLYDENSQAYYETTLSMVSVAVMSRMKAFEDEYRKRFAELEKEALETMETLKSQQSQFISDTASNVDKLIDLVYKTEA